MLYFNYIQRVEEIYEDLIKENGESSTTETSAINLVDREYQDFLNEINDWLDELKNNYFVVDGIINMWNGTRDLNNMIIKLHNMKDFLSYIVDDADNLVINFDMKKGTISIEKDHHDGSNYYTLTSLDKKTKQEIKQMLIDLTEDIELIREKAQTYFGRPLSKISKEELCELLYELYGYEL